MNKNMYFSRIIVLKLNLKLTISVTVFRRYHWFKGCAYLTSYLTEVVSDHVENFLVYICNVVKYEQPLS